MAEMMPTYDPVALAMVQPHGAGYEQGDPEDDRRRRALVNYLMWQRAQKKPDQGETGGVESGGGPFDLLGKVGAGGGGAMNLGGMGGGGSGFSGSPWDALFSAIGPIHGGLEGNDPNTPFVPKGRTPHDSDNALIGAGGTLGTLGGSIFGMPGVGRMAGQNIGATFSDLAHGDINNLGRDVSANLPPLPGMQREGWKGLLNGATGLPIASLFDLFK